MDKYIVRKDGREVCTMEGEDARVVSAVAANLYGDGVYEVTLASRYQPEDDEEAE